MSQCSKGGVDDVDGTTILPVIVTSLDNFAQHVAESKEGKMMLKRLGALPWLDYVTLSNNALERILHAYKIDMIVTSWLYVFPFFS